MGSKSSDTPPPDPRLIEAQIRSLGVQDDAIQRILANADSMMPLQREATRFALDQSRLSATQAQDDRNWMLTRRAMLSGVQDRMVADANTFDARVRGDELAQEATADAAVAIDNARRSSARDLARRGVAPGSGRAGDARLVLGEAALQAGASNTARRAARTEGYALTDRATNALAGYPAMSMSASGQGAQIAAGGVNVANAGAAGMTAGAGAAAGVAGQMGSNATSMWNAQANYKTAQDKLAADNDPLNTVLGAVAGGVGTGLGLKLMSDRRLKTDIVPVGRDERTGLPLYEFGYIGATDGKRYRGVMADEVERYDPKAVSYDDLGFASVDYARLGIEMVEV
jgi:hypothetical protein